MLSTFSFSFPSFHIKCIKKKRKENLDIFTEQRERVQWQWGEGKQCAEQKEYAPAEKGRQVME